jgi:hypothetical protein
VHESLNIPIADIPLITPRRDDEDEIRFMRNEFGGVFPWERPRGWPPLGHCYPYGHLTARTLLDVIYAAPSQRQMLRVLRVDCMSPHVFFCDDELQAFFAEANNLSPRQGILQSLHDVATGLQKCFLSRPLQQSLCEKILQAQEDICYYLRKEIEYFQGKETQLLQDWPLEGPGAFAREFISLVLPLLQTYRAEVYVHATGVIGIDNPKYQSSYHLVSILPEGVEFDFRESIGASSLLLVKWEELRSLAQLGISFILTKPEEVPLQERFGVVQPFSAATVFADNCLQEEQEERNRAGADKTEESTFLTGGVNNTLTSPSTLDADDTLPWACTVDNCLKAFGSKNDWTIHEIKQHEQQECWRCEEADSNKSGESMLASTDDACMRVFYTKDLYSEHLKQAHEFRDSGVINEMCGKKRIGQKAQVQFWCGFCRRVVPLKEIGIAGVRERYNHIDHHFSKEKCNIKQWEPLNGRPSEGESTPTAEQTSPTESRRRGSCEEDKLEEDGTEEVGMGWVFVN